MYLCANLSMMFTELPMTERFSAAQDAGFDGVEIQFPDEEDMAALARARAEVGIRVTLINVPRGGPQEAGLAALPGREADFAAAVETCRRNAEALGAEKVNILAGLTHDAPFEACAETLTRNLRHAADAFAADGRRVMVEPVNPHDVPGFFLHGLDAGLAALDRADHSNLWLQFDLYHMAITEPDLLAATLRAGPRIGHVQFADTPGRHEPGSGGIDFVAALAALTATGYDDAVSAEYRPKGRTEAGLGWLPRLRKALA
jgi:hydroxypyruvate isomerase